VRYFSLLSEITLKYVIIRLERLYVRNITIEEQRKKLNTVVTKRKTVLSGKCEIADWKHVFTTPEILDDVEAKKYQEREDIRCKKW
jgi:hypothetical protein